MNYMSSAPRPSMIDRFAPPPVAPAERPPVGRLLRFGYGATAVVAALFLLWATIAPLSGAAIASGVLRPEGGGRKVVQNLEGGIVRAVHVREGQRVRSGQLLIEIDPTQTAAADAALQANHDALLAQDARLDAEMRGAARVAYPSSLTARAGEPRVAQVIAASDALFSTRRDALGGQIAVMGQQIAQTRAEIASYGSQIAAVAGQARLLDEEAASANALVEQGLERRSRALGLERQREGAVGAQGQLRANVARAERQIAETRAQMALLRRQQLNEVAAQQREVRASIAEIEEKLGAVRDVLARRRVVAPVDGTVVNLRTITLGGVVAAGGEILDIVPADEPVMIQARVRAIDADVVHPGLEAGVRLTPFNARTMPMLRGVVRHVSADAIRDEATGEMFYEARVTVSPAELRRAGDPRLTSGMPAEVFIETGARSLFGYLFEPLTDSFARAMRES